MKCIHDQCEKEAQAICKFCGRAVCKEHISKGCYVSGFASFKIYQFRKNGIEIPDAVWCGLCHPKTRFAF